jgi:hypothetical protein
MRGPLDTLDLLLKLLVCMHCVGNHLVSQCDYQFIHRDEDEVVNENQIRSDLPRDKKFMSHRCHMCEHRANLKADTVSRLAPGSDAERAETYKNSSGVEHEAR